jgi:MiaB/RimO family radical SAM methylthiotransferase
MIVVLSQGCAANFGDGEKIARILSQKSEVTFEFPEAKPAHSTRAASFSSKTPANLENVENSTNAANPADFSTEKPEAFYLNVCTVKGNAGAMKLLRKAASTFPGVPIFITGCAPKDFREEALRTVPHVQFTSLKELEDSAHSANSRNVLRESPFVGIVNIEEGCLDACAFCSTHLVKGRLHSFAPNAIVDQVQALVDDGCLEIQLTGQDCACYGFDIGTNLAELTQRILTHVNGNYRIRLGMGNPRHVLSYQEALLDCFTDDRIYKFIHIPVQSGSENVLKAMNRRHTARDYATLAHAFTERFRKFTLSTDLIVGYPGETAEDFNDTLKLLKETRPTVCNITRFVARPGTVAAHLETSKPTHPESAKNSAHLAHAPLAIPDDIKHERSVILAEAFQQIALENNREWIGDECIVVTEKPGYRAGTTIARNEAYRPVALQGTFPAGKTLRVRITGAEPFALLAKPLA